MSRNPHVAAALAAMKSGDLDRARQAAADGIAGDPASPDLQHLAGLIECRSGHPDRAIPHLQSAVDTEPTNTPFRLMLMRALVDTARFGEALALSDPAAHSTLPLPLWHARAEAADGAEDWARSAEAWGTVARAVPGDWRAFANAGNALLRLNRWAEAQAALERAAALNPNDSAIRFSLAAALAQSGRADAAIAEFLHGLESDPANIQGRLILARLYADRGDGAAATRQLDLAAEQAASGPSDGFAIGLGAGDGSSSTIMLDPADTLSIREVGRLFERTGRTEDLRRLVGQADKAGIPDDDFGYLRASLALGDGDAAAADRHLQGEDPGTDPVRWHRLAARIADALDDPARAFAAADRMNRSVADFDGWRRRGAAYRAHVRSIAGAFGNGTAAGIAAIPETRRPSPAFLVGFPRSGTTLLDTFLMGHPGARVLEEVHLLGPAERKIGNYQSLHRATPAMLAAARDAYFDVLDRHVDPGFDGLVIDKMPLNMIGLPLIRAMFPDARILFAQRHPADCVLSSYMQSFTLNDAMASFLDIGDAADFYDAAMTAFRAGCDALPGPLYFLAYEDLVRDPAGALRPAVEFLGLEWTDAMLDHQSTARARGVIVTPSYDQVLRPLDRSASGRWQRYAEQLAPVLPLLLGWADRLGYARPDGENSQHSRKSTAE